MLEIDDIVGCPSIRIRKDIRSLSQTERNDLDQAMAKFKISPEYATIASYHNTYHEMGFQRSCDCEHQTNLFSPWHTAFLIRFENALGKYLNDDTLGLPYFDWTDLQVYIYNFMTPDNSK